MTKRPNRSTPTTFAPPEVATIRRAIALNPGSTIECPRCNEPLEFDRHLEGGTSLTCPTCKRTCIVRRDLRD